MVRLKEKNGGIIPTVTEFQFLMVRLKEGIEVGSWFFMFISIPYGSIKRLRGFQKGVKEKHFNSLWFD